MDKMQFENGVLVTPAKVVIDGVEHEVTPAVYEGKTPFSAENINQMQDNIERAIPAVKDNLESDSATDALSAKQGKVLKDAIKTKYILATVGDAQTISGGYEVSLNMVVFNNTNCVLENGKIKIGSGINKIKTSSSIFVDNWPMGTNYLWGIIRKNGSNICGSIESSTCVCLSCTNATMITDVQEGDLISLVADSPSGGNLRAGESNTFILIEVIS